MQVLLTADGRSEAGGTPLVVHNERLADPLDDYARAIAAVSKKRNKTEADLWEISRLEFYGSLYTNGNGPCLPAWNVLRCLQDGAKRIKRGQDVLRGVFPLTEHADLVYDGPRDPEELWKDGSFRLRKTVGVQKNRTPRTRGMFTEWSFSLPVEVDPVIFDPDTLSECWRHAGRYAGLGEMRPIYGKFLATATEWPMSQDVAVEEAAYALAMSVSAEQVQRDDQNRAERYVSPASRLVEAAAEKAKSLRGHGNGHA
ncbi:hypothetical protein ER308_07250 [Egibacter rhizosphaerae]|uniref:Uncharacterized protein n=1 Tax=Egibacter rhizosphaerae TaxID=1670831 RepID=A0A411YDU0_9ACTN|nr:hypothetical protein [Egibacter rhizosphaerae]QBI19361.1 hypothetical protein ER308_07250 [Egibacter rhizosphaerae]